VKTCSRCGRVRKAGEYIDGGQNMGVKISEQDMRDRRFWETYPQFCGSQDCYGCLPDKVLCPDHNAEWWGKRR
jgi:hypothetical protein